MTLKNKLSKIKMNLKKIKEDRNKTGKLRKNLFKNKFKN